MIRLNLGSGYYKMEGWENLDAVYGHILPGALRRYSTGSVAEIFSEHFIEHLKWRDALEVMRECRRVLHPDGVLRLSCPDLRALVDRYLQGKLREYGGAWLPETACAMMNEGMREWGHLYMYDQPELERLARLAGFTRVQFTERHAHCLRYNFGDLYLLAQP